ncbi:hypothetical protein [Catellatospora vulcania]|uniref:hypothetical protein n=1 Tax=Catellatospora vulcania TaxID=1460450 RepID=UPI0012D37894|nr:hypothetical protein [Catellatospora vulcania]
MNSNTFGTPARRRAMLGTALLACAATALLAGCDPQSPSAPAPSTAPTTAASASTAPSAAAVPGTFYFLKEAGSGQAVVRLRGGVAEQAWTTDGGTCPGNSVVVSPDGKHLAWVKDAGDTTGSTGTLTITDASGRARETVKQVSCLGSSSIRWAADSATLYVTLLADGKETRGRVALATGRFSAMSHADWTAASRPASPFRGVIADGKLTVTKADGSAPRSVDYQDPNGMDAIVLGVSHDGRLAAASVGAGDPSRQLGVAAVIDMTTGKPVEFTVGKVDRVYFQPDGTMIVQVGGAQPVLYHLAADGRVIAQAPVSDAKLAGASLFQAVIG